MVNIEINQSNPLQAMHLERVSNAHRHIVEKTESHGGCTLGMVARRADIAESPAHFAREHQVGGLNRSACRMQRSLKRMWIHRGIGVNGFKAAAWRTSTQGGHMQQVMRAGELRVGSLGGFMMVHEVEQSALQQAVADHGPALRALGVTFAHGVTKETRMRDVGSLHR